MPSGPLTGNHPKKLRVYERDGLTITVVPDPRAEWDRRNKYWLQVNGETVGTIAYLSGRWTRGWAIHSLMPALKHYGSAVAANYQKAEVAAGKTFGECIALVPELHREGRLPTPSEVAAELAKIDAAKAEKDAQREREKVERQAREEREREAAECVRLETLEGLRSIRDNLRAGLTNFELSALEAAITRFAK